LLTAKRCGRGEVVRVLKEAQEGRVVG
jgi:hypothetical protein